MKKIQFGKATIANVLQIKATQKLVNNGKNIQISEGHTSLTIGIFCKYGNPRNFTSAYSIEQNSLQ